jgi:alpha,alpha-trehalose phosphorylase
MALVGGFGGMRTDGGTLSFRPKLAPGIVGLSFRMRFRGRILHVEVRGGKAQYCVISGPPLEIGHYGTPITITSSPVALEIPAQDPLPEPSQPAGRAPQARRARNQGLP